MSLRPLEQDFQPFGDSTGLEALAEALPASKAPARKKPLHLYWIFAFALLGVAASLGASALLTVQSLRNSQAVWAAQTGNYREALQHGFSEAQILLHSLRGSHAGTGTISRIAFDTLADELQRFFPSLHVIAWIPRVKVRNIAATERAAAASGLQNFRVLNIGGAPAGAGLSPDDDVFPVYFSARGNSPHDRNQAPLGTNLLSAPGRKEFLGQNCNSGGVLAANWPALLDRGGGLGYLALYLAVHVANAPSAPPGSPCPGLTGYFSALLRVDVLLVSSFRTLPPIEADIYLVDPKAQAGQQVIGFYGTPSHNPNPAPLSLGDLTAQTGASHMMEIGGLKLDLMFVPMPRDWGSQISQSSWAVLVFGLMLTAALTTFLVKQRTATRIVMAEVDRRFKLEQALRASEYRFRLALRDSHVAVFSQDRELRYTWIFNPNLVGLEPRDIVGKRHSELFPGGANREMEELKRRVITTGLSARQEIQLVAAGHTYFRDLRIEPLHDRTGAIIGIICVSIDVTEAKHMKEELNRSVAVAERAVATKSRFLAAASHDLRQPFQAMLLLYELLRVRLTEPLHQELCAQLGESIKAGQDLLTALLDISTLDAGVITPRLSSFPLLPSLQTLVAEFREQSIQVNIALRLVPTGIVVRSDRVLLERILRNLIANALRYIERGHILIGCRRRRGQVEIQVWDTGIGIPPDQIELVFEDFYQVGNQERRPSQGLGLGLGIVARTAKLLGHTIAVHSQPGRGSVFTLTVATAAESEPEPPEQPPVIPDSPPPQCILVVEDDEMQRGALKLLLEESGHRVLCAASPEAATDLITAGVTEQPTLIISDLRLPGPLSGVEAIALLRILIGSPVPALLTTGDTDEHLLRYATAAGNAILHKPFNHAALTRMLSTLVVAPAGQDSSSETSSGTAPASWRTVI